MADGKTSKKPLKGKPATKGPAKSKPASAKKPRTQKPASSRAAAKPPAVKAATKAPRAAATTMPTMATVEAALASKARVTPRPPRSRDEDAPRRVALAAVEAGLDKKALNAEIIDVRGKVDYCDYVVVMSGRSDRQVNAICQGVEKDLREKHGQRCHAREGLTQGQWALMDFGDVVIHVFHEDTRGYYDIESLWMDAARLPVPVSGPPSKSE